MIVLLAACGRGPEAAVRRFLDIAASHQRDRLFEELGPATQYRMKQDAERAALMAGRRPVAPPQMLAVEVPPGAYRLRTLRHSGDEAEVEAEIVGYKQRFRCVRVAGKWKVEL